MASKKYDNFFLDSEKGPKDAKKGQNSPFSFAKKDTGLKEYTTAVVTNELCLVGPVGLVVLLRLMSLPTLLCLVGMGCQV